MDKSDRIVKFASVKAAEPDVQAMEAINRHALEPLTPEQVYCFSLNACDDQLDRQHEHFTVECLQELAALYVGRTVLFDHEWSAKSQCARIYEARVVEDGGVHRLRFSCYMLQNEQTAATIEAIKAGILKEVSVGCRCTSVCNLCGRDYWNGCRHLAGQTYDVKVCTVRLEHATDAYEVSFVAVPAQKEAGVTKQLDNPELTDGEKQKAFAWREAKLLELEEEIFEI